MTAAIHPSDDARSLVGRAVRFGGVGASGVVVNQLALVALLATTPLHYLAAAVVATQLAIASNFVLTERFVYADRRSGGRHDAPARARRFWLVNSAALLAHGPLLVALTEGTRLAAAEANLVVLALLALGRFAVADRLIWTPARHGAPRRPATAAEEVAA